jgi:Protein of unknown function (DUF1579)
MLFSRKKGLEMRWQFRARRFVALIVAMALAFFILASLAGSRVARPANDRQAEAFDVLERFAGDWTTRAKIHHAGPPPRTIETEGRAECRETLEGRYFEFRTKSARPVQADLQIMTYDADAAVFRQWVFSSDGYRHEAQGQWSPASSTLRWKGKTGDGSFEIEDRWVSRDRLEWTLRRTDAAGRTVQTIEGTVDRVTTRSYCVATQSRDQEHQARDESRLDD